LSFAKKIFGDKTHCEAYEKYVEDFGISADGFGTEATVEILAGIRASDESARKIQPKIPLHECLKYNTLALI
jgi:hypothetical protein